MKNAEAEREKELKAAQQKLNQAKSKADAYNKRLKEKTAGTFQILRHVSGSRLTKLHCVYTGCVTSQQLEAEHLLFLNHLSPSFSRRQTQ